jgi:hypothetical protein
MIAQAHAMLSEKLNKIILTFQLSISDMCLYSNELESTKTPRAPFDHSMLA